MPANASLVPKYETEKLNGNEENPVLREMREHFAAISDALRSRDAQINALAQQVHVIGEQARIASSNSAGNGLQLLDLGKKLAALESMLTEQKSQLDNIDSRTVNQWSVVEQLNRNGTAIEKMGTAIIEFAKSSSEEMKRTVQFFHSRLVAIEEKLGYGLTKKEWQRIREWIRSGEAGGRTW